VNDPRPKPPGTALSRAALERVLARAAELQATGGEGDDAGAMTEEQLVELGKEVGLSADLIRQALAEERARPLLPVEAGWLATVTGAAAVTAARTVPGSPAAVLGALDAWMQRAEALQVKRRFADQLVWEARRDVFSVIRRSLPIWGRGFDLVQANDVSAIVTALGPDKAHARIVADFSVARGRRATVGSALGFALLLATAPLIVMGVSPVLAAIPAALSAVLAVLITRRQYRQLVERAQVSLEQALDRLEFAEARPATTAQALLDAFIRPPRPPR